MNVEQVMSSRPISVDAAESVAVAARLLSRYNVGALPVCSGDGQLRGIVTDRDIALRCVAAGQDPQALTVAAIMSNRLITAQPREPVQAAADRMAREQVRRLPVTDQGRLVGMLSLADVAKSQPVAGTVDRICSNVIRR